ncbi:extracellular solute-binding protein [Paenibacillus sp. J5C_2022]|uniref:extracellular solute-binding protein n=1 Tax=Paenibacillus sp. J5C2022 TaxID=2977129 RepID=UPI0021D20C67|nr:extracellular solute-binding protein [Paenibacillus sp. J5C2022]MCU6711460.1 extracellular solute-binding protein [Paenibacillus sp. J5C2022]
MFKKEIVGCSILLCVMIVFAGCSIGNSGNKPSIGEEGKGGAKEVAVKLMRVEHQSQALKTDTPVLREILDKTGVKLQVEGVPASNWTDKKRILMATNNMPDVMLVEQNEINEFAGTSIFLPISDYLDQMPNFKKTLEDNPEIKRLYVDGKMYGFPLSVQHNLQAAKAPMIRTDLLKKLNLEAPRSFDELYTVLKKLKEYDPDSIPWTTRGLHSFMDAVAFGMGSGFGLYYDPDLNGGSYVYGTSKPKFKEVLTYLNKLYTEKLLDPDFAVNTHESWVEKLSSGKSFFYYDNDTFAANFNDTLRKDDPEAEFNLIPYLSNNEGNSRGWLYPRGWITQSYAISSKVKDPEAVIKMYDWLYSPEGAVASNFGILGETYELVDDQPVFLDEVIDKYKTAPDPARSMLSDIGGGLLAISPLVDERALMQTSNPETLAWSEQLKGDPGAYVIPGVGPSLTKEENERLKQLATKYVPLEQDVLNFIMGTRPLSEFDQFAEELEKNGIPELEKIHNDALARVGK